MIPLSEPYLNGREWEYLKECLDTNWLSSAGPFVERFEREIIRQVRVPNAVALASGTAALHLALIAAGIGPGDFVLVSDLTFVAPVNAIKYVGATPILVDADPNTWQMDHELVAKKLAEETELREEGCYWPEGKGYIKAMLPVHILGGSCEMERLQQLAGQYQMILIEDASEALGTIHDGKPCGSWGDMGVLSFNGNKIITSGGGGMFLCQASEFAEEVRHLSTQARTDALHYIHDKIGYNYRISNLHAALGLAQLEQLDSFVLQRKNNAAYYQARLSTIPDLQFQTHEVFCQPNQWLFSIVIPDKEALMKQMLAAEIGCRSIWAPMHQLPMYQACSLWSHAQLAEHKSESARIFSGGLSLPSSASLSEEEIDQVCTVIEAFAKG
ncbi:MAG: aminotransferase class I/II-fold pyridoxal phosphate-dependent enzyme [Bacteroidia bacterium]